MPPDLQHIKTHQTLPDCGEDDRDKTHAQQLDTGADEDAEEHRVLGGRAEDVSVHQLQKEVRCDM